MAVERITFDVPAEIEAGLAGKKRVRDENVWVGLLQARENRVSVGETDHFKPFVPQNALAHALRVRTIVREQNATHLLEAVSVAFGSAGCACGVVSVAFFFFFSFFFGTNGWLVTEGACTVVSAGDEAVVSLASPGLGSSVSRASGFFSSAVEFSGTWVATTSGAVVTACTGTLIGARGAIVAMAGVPLRAALLTSGPRRTMSVALANRPCFTGCSWSYFMRAIAAGSASGTGASRAVSFFLASSTRLPSG